jgi:hypothetical protein
MSRRLRILVPTLLVAGVVAAGMLLSGGLGGLVPGGPGASGAASLGAGPGHSGAPGSTVDPSPTPVPPLGGTELYGYVPYWQMSGSTVNHLRDLPLSTIALFSVTARRTGAIDTRPNGYRRITGPIGARIIEDAHARGARVELVFTSFGPDRNARLFRPSAPPSPAPGSTTAPLATAAPPPPPGPEPWRRTVGELVDLVVDLRLDGINVDVEQLDEADRPAYGEFLTALRAALVEAVPDARLSVATEAGLRGTGNAAAAAAAGVDRVFLMGYDYHWSGSQPGASSPVDRTDGLYDLRWSIDQYVGAGVPRDRILLGLPLYGMSWRTIGPDRTSAVLEAGSAWIPSLHRDQLLDPAFEPGRDLIELAEFFVEPDGDAWRITYFDSPATLRPKLALARDHGLAGGGFWAIGYERGLPGFHDLMADFRAGRVERSEAPPLQP